MATVFLMGRPLFDYTRTMKSAPDTLPVLALDPGSSFTGWCRSDGACGTFRLKDYPDKGAGLAAFVMWLEGQCREGLGGVIIERPGFTMRATNADLVHGLIWAAHAVAFRYGIERREMRADSVRKALIGRARRNKGESVKDFDKVMLKAVAMAGLLPGNEHETDAAALLLVGTDNFRSVMSADKGH